jgi:hypothetical protein
MIEVRCYVEAIGVSGGESRYSRGVRSLSLLVFPCLAACATGLTGTPDAIDASSTGTPDAGDASTTPEASADDAASDVAPPTNDAPADAPPPACRFDTRAYLGDGTESITAYGKYWNYDSTSKLVSTGDPVQVPRYASGPCAGKAAGTCALGTRTFLSDGTESITVGDDYWNYDGAGNLLSNGKLDAVPRYASGPCLGRAAGSCSFESRTFLPDGTESITAYGLYFNYTGAGALISSGDLTAVPRYASGPCAGKGAGACAFETRTFLPGGNESITIDGVAWTFDPAGAPLGSGSLFTVARYAAGPCAGH